jgi:hypothetical protein
MENEKQITGCGFLSRHKMFFSSPSHRPTHFEVKSGPGMRDGSVSEIPGLLSLISGLVHDIDHPGHSNSFEVNTMSALAKRYDNQSVLENHHIDTALSLLKIPGCNILESLSCTLQERFKTILRGKYIISYISIFEYIKLK